MKQIKFEESSLGTLLSVMTNDQLDELEFGVIGFDTECLVKIYNKYESEATGLSVQSVIDTDLFLAVAICMNNFLIAQRFEDALDETSELDDTIDYVLTFKMKPTRVKLRLISNPMLPFRFVCVLRSI